MFAKPTRIVVEYTDSVFKLKNRYAVKVNTAAKLGWHMELVTPQNPLVVVEYPGPVKLALNLGTEFCYLEFHNPLTFPSYVRIQGRSSIVGQGKRLTHTQARKLVVIDQLTDTETKNWYVLVRTQ